MYAIVEILGQQFKVEAGRKLYIHRMNVAERGSAVEFDKVLLVDNDGAITVGAPVVEGAYRVRNGHRQDFTEILIKEIVA